MILLLDVMEDAESEVVRVFDAWSGVVVEVGGETGRVFTTKVVESGGGTLEVVVPVDFVGAGVASDDDGVSNSGGRVYRDDVLVG